VKTILNTENRGQSAVLNQALQLAEGEYIALLPSDDWFLPEKTALQVAKMQECSQEVGVVYAAGARYFEDTGETRPVDLPVHTGWIARDLIERGNFIYPVTPLYKREVFYRVKPSEKFKAEGEAIHLRAALHYRYEYVDEVVAVMRDHSYNIGKDAEVLYDEIQQLWEWYFDLPELPDDIRRLKKAAIFRNHSTKGMQLIVDHRKYEKGRLCLRRAFTLSWKGMLRPKYLVAYCVSLLPYSFSNAVFDRIKRK
jgi:glycosyltransferase involved in cell wall biosynthesis